ncbi:MAG: PQQ-binding-like beta-propeller repeat protein [Chitinophagaceae bacterium]|nr:PQQ-binding-like beta-propeller repeat protein [Chitinophagaceae bacterium]
MVYKNTHFTSVRKVFLSAIVFSFVIASCKSKDEQYTTWSVYRGDEGSRAYSALDQINTDNINELELAWTYHTGDGREGNFSSIQCNPIMVNGMMYITSPQLKLIALEPASGKEIWKFDPFREKNATGVNRGVVYWAEGDDKRIFFSAGYYLYALNADDGSFKMDFGNGGKIDLREGLGRDPEKQEVDASSPGIIYKNLLIQGSSLGEGYEAAPGFIRAYNVKTGKIEWTFHTIPQPGEFGYDTWEKDNYLYTGGANAWGGMCLDRDRGTVFIPTGSPGFDFYGGNRKGDNLFGNCLIALDAATGKRKWHQQLVHHDLWDYDLPAPPTLVTINKEGKKIDAVAQITKMGMVFIFDRDSGEPVFPIEERPVPASDLLGEASSPTQPFPVKPAPFSRQHFTDDSITNISDSAYLFVKEKVKNARKGGIYMPHSVQGTVQFPGTRGGGEWGGASFDPETGMLYVNGNEVPMLISMKKISADDKRMSMGERIFAINNCTECHGADRSGNGIFPALRELSKKYDEAQITDLLKNGRGQMPAFPNLSDTERSALVNFLLDRKENPEAAGAAQDTTTGIRYVHSGWTPLTDQDGYPGVKPPWGTLNAIDLNKGEIVWKVPLGEYPELMKKGLPATGTPNLGGAVTTAGGLVFIAATKDEKFRAFDKTTGKLLWEYKLPYGGFATPGSYLVDGKQYIVIAAGGGSKVGSPSGDAYLAFRLKAK